MLQVFALVAVLGLCLQGEASPSSPDPVQFAFVVSEPGSGLYTDDRGALSDAVDEALQLINDDSTILPGYDMVYSGAIRTEVSQS